MPQETSSQNFLQFKQIKDGIIVLKNRTLRGVLMVSSINFDLKSEDEQNATIYQFQSFLNSLDFSCQICVQSRRLNITGYFERLKELEIAQKNELLKTQIAEYRKFVQNLVEEGTIMTKQFFVVVPYALGEISLKKGLLGLKQKGPTMTDENFTMCKEQLLQRMEFVAVGLKRCGLSVVPLTSPELIELFWSWHHPKEAEVGYYPEIMPELIK
ncbi:hypothetical protein FJ208_01280 [Candidatus Gribaldobacteria bacterium]|nr:hypothetical protein [Candidatus Gribaldobacteria bacterium]